MANVLYKKDNDVVEVLSTDATAIAAWVALGYTLAGTAEDTLSQDSVITTDLQVKDKIIFGELQSSSSWALAYTGGNMLLMGCTGGDYVSEYVFEKDSTEKVVSVSGIIGAAGATGVVGPVGATGTVGITGLAGAVGVTGVAGVAGATGAIGITGLQGAQGVTGLSA